MDDTELKQLDKDILKGRLLVGAIQERDARTSQYLWELADLSAIHTRTSGRPSKGAADASFYTIEEWANEIGWIDQGNTVGYLKKIIQEARAWPEELRVPTRTLEQHRDARAAHGGDAIAAQKWLLSLEGKKNIRDRARNISEITGSGPVYEATLKLRRARTEIVGIPAKLAASGILGNEENFPQFQRELSRLKNAIEYLDRYLADETVVDRDALDDALDRILAGEEA